MFINLYNRKILAYKLNFNNKTNDKIISYNVNNRTTFLIIHFFIKIGWYLKKKTKIKYWFDGYFHIKINNLFLFHCSSIKLFLTYIRVFFCYIKIMYILGIMTISNDTLKNIII